MVNNSRENMIATLWLLTLTLITASECVYAPPPLVEYRRSEDSTPLGIQDDYFMGEERPKRQSLSIKDSINTLRSSLLNMRQRELMEQKSQQIQQNRRYLNKIGKRGNERYSPIEQEYYEPYQQHIDLGTLIRTLSDANPQPYNLPADTVFNENNDIDGISRIPLKNMHFNIDEDAHIDRFIDLNDERAWLHAKQQRHFNQLQKQRRLNEQNNKNFLHQLDNNNKQLNTQVPSQRAQQQQQLQQQQNQQQENQQQQKQQRQPDNSQQPIKSFDNDERFMLQTFDTN